jgi:hypothetical protein
MTLLGRTALALLVFTATAPAPAAPQSAAGGFEDGIPFWVWRALPQVFPEYVPGAGGYLSFGFEWNRGEQLPVGLSMTEDRVPVIRSESGPAGVGGVRPNLEAYRQFLLSAARDPRFTADNIMPIIQYNVRLSLIDKLRYRYLVIPRAREALMRLGNG